MKTSRKVNICQRVRLWLVSGTLLATSLGVPAGFADGAAPPPTAGRCALTRGDIVDPDQHCMAGNLHVGPTAGIAYNVILCRRPVILSP